MREFGTNISGLAERMINKKEFNELLELIKKLNKEVEIIKNKEFSVTLKKDQSPLTEADLHVNNKLNEYFASTDFKNVISEENERINYTQRSKWKTYWVVDPIDGTKEFVKKGSDYTINIALCNGIKPVFGLVSAPATGDIYTAFLNGGSYKNNKKISVKKKSKFLKIVASKSHINDETSAFIDNLSKQNKIELINIGSSLKICFLAEGKADLYPRFGPTMEWDTCASQIILEEAGGNLKDLNGSPLIYNKSNFLNPFFIASC